MVDDNDWRLQGQDYLQGATLFHRAWRQTRRDWDHDHCDFCFAKIASRGIEDALHEGWATADEYHWVCDTCYQDFKGRFEWREPSAPPVNVLEAIDASSDVFTAIDVAERILPGVAGDGPNDPRWQAIISIADYLESQPEPIWQFITRWAPYPDDDLRDAIATCLLEHVLDRHFERYIAVVEEAVRRDRGFAATFTRCGQFGQSELAGNAERFDRLKVQAWTWLDDVLHLVARGRMSRTDCPCSPAVMDQLLVR